MKIPDKKTQGLNGRHERQYTRHVFGPVPSRRLGRSLGVDLVPFKTCTYDCIYCQLGRTTCKTIERKEWVPLDDVVRELKMRLESRPDYITLSGSGEPTLYSRIDELIGAIKTITEIPVAVLTNGSLLWQPEVRAQLMKADVVIPSLDAGDELRFRAINRPHPQIAFDQMVNGLMEFRREYRGQYWLEVFLLEGYTAIQAEVEKLARLVKRIQPDKVQLNTVDRPPAEEFALAVSARRMQKLALLFDPPAEVITKFRRCHVGGQFKANRDVLLNLLRRRPCTVEEIAEGLGWHRNEADKLLADLEARGLIGRCITGGVIHYQAVAILDHKRQEMPNTIETPSARKQR
jgi:wyosine [tRNA(Phe)-imidazoG37] synthetase (radical SAM superfamily)